MQVVADCNVAGVTARGEGKMAREREKGKRRDIPRGWRERWRARSKPDEQTQSGKSRWRGRPDFCVRLCASDTYSQHTESRVARKGRDGKQFCGAEKETPDELERKEELKDETEKDDVRGGDR